MCRSVYTHLFTAALIIFCLSGAASSSQESSVSEVIRDRMDLLGSMGSLEIGEEGIRGRLILPMFYERRDFEPVWSDPGRFQELRKLIAASADDGLLPEDYHLDAIERIAGDGDRTKDPYSGADLDILCTDALLGLAYHMKFGKVDPERLDSDWNIYEDMAELTEMIDHMEEVFEGGSGSVTRAMDDIRPSYEIYRDLSRALVEYREIEAEGGWAAVPEGEALKEGMRDQRVIKLRERLAVTGDLEIEGPADDLFDEELARGVENFQKRHGLDADGVAGKMTIAALNMPVSGKIDRIRVNLERLRWVLQDDSRSFIVVNIAGFELFYGKDEEILWRARVQVGKEYRKTPVFRADLEYIVFNPTWTVPPVPMASRALPHRLPTICARRWTSTRI